MNSQKFSGCPFLDKPISWSQVPGKRTASRHVPPFPSSPPSLPVYVKSMLQLWYYPGLHNISDPDILALKSPSPDISDPDIS